MTHIIGLRKNTLTKTFRTQRPDLTPRSGGHERKPPIRPFVRDFYLFVCLKVEFAEVLEDVEIGGHFGDVILISANPVLYEYVCGCLGVCMCARDHNGNTTPPPSSAGSQSEHCHSNPTIFCRIYLGAYLITGKTRLHCRSIQFTVTVSQVTLSRTGFDTNICEANLVKLTKS